MIPLFSPDRIIALIFLFLVTAYSGFSQTFFGNITDIHGLPVKGAIVTVTKSDGTVEHHYSDDNGRIEMLNLPFGKLTIEVNKEGYQPVNMTTWYTIQTRHDLEITLEKTWDLTMDSVTVTASTQLADFDGIIRMNRSQYKTMAGSFQDPSRILLHYPGFTTNNDGTNQFSYRGLPDYGTYWQVFDAEILNPNHLSTAGNRGDAVSQQFGGVNSLTSSVIDQYTFQPIGNSISQSNSIGGVSNITFNKKINNYADVSLIGAEAGMCLKIGNKSIYGTGRYSFVGLLEKLGVPFGNESINYQDFTLHSEIFKTKKVTLSGYAAYGQSSNIHNALRPEEEKSVYKDFQNIRYAGRFGLVGLHAQVRLAENHKLNITMNYSLRRDNNQQQLDSKYENIIPENNSKNNYSSNLNSFHIKYNFWFKRHEFKVGVRYNTLNQQSQDTYFKYSFVHSRFYPYSEYKLKLKNYVFTGGISIQTVYSKDDIYSFIPNFVNYSIRIDRKLGADLHLVLQNRLADQFTPDATLRNISNFHTNEMYVKSNNIELSLRKNSNKVHWGITAFYNFIFDLNVAKIEEGSYGSSMNGLDYGVENNILDIEYFGYTGHTKGIEIFAQKNFIISDQIKLECLGNLTYLNSKYNLELLPESRNNLPGKYDIGFLGSFSTYVTIQRNSKEWIFGFNFHGREGTREYYTDLNNPILYETNKGMTNQLSPYMRLDARIVYSKKGGKNRRHRISLDVQNVTNRLNDGYSYIDAYLRSVNRVNQLGLVPVLGYRFEY